MLKYFVYQNYFSIYLKFRKLKYRDIIKQAKSEEVRTFEEVFPDSSPAMTLRGYRGKMEWTQKELADKLGTTQNRISNMESGKRRISLNMAKRLSELFNIPYKVFL